MSDFNLNSVFIACSIDGYITDRNGGLDWLHAVPDTGNGMDSTDNTI